VGRLLQGDIAGAWQCYRQRDREEDAQSSSL
jgi:hypothetical protein